MLGTTSWKIQNDIRWNYFASSVCNSCMVPAVHPCARRGKNGRSMSKLREYLRANMFDGHEGGTVTIDVSYLLDEIEDIVGWWICEQLEIKAEA